MELAFCSNSFQVISLRNEAALLDSISEYSRQVVWRFSSSCGFISTKATSLPYIKGASAADDVTLAVIAAIDALPASVKLSDKPLVEAARAAYEAIATIQQKALVTNLSKLEEAERRISDLEYLQNQEQNTENPNEAPNVGGDCNKPALTSEQIIMIIVGAAFAVVLALAVVFMILWLKTRKKSTTPPDSTTPNTDETVETEANAEESSESYSDAADADETESDTATEEASNAEASSEENSDLGDKTNEENN